MHTVSKEVSEREAVEEPTAAAEEGLEIGHLSDLRVERRYAVQSGDGRSLWIRA